MTVSLRQARTICSPSELTLVLESTASQLRLLGEKQLKIKVSRARVLRDKWRGMVEKQVRVSKKKSQTKTDLDNRRTEEKYQLFAETLDRFSKRLEVLAGKESSPVRSKAKTRKPTVKAQHRAQRFDARTVLADTKDTLNTVVQPKPEPTAKVAAKAKKTSITKSKKPTLKKAAAAKKTNRPAVNSSAINVKSKKVASKKKTGLNHPTSKASLAFRVLDLALRGSFRQTPCWMCGIFSRHRVRDCVDDRLSQLQIGEKSLQRFFVVT